MSGILHSQAIGDLLRRSARRTPAKTAIVYGDLRQSFAELDAVVNRTANAIAAKGIVRGDRVAILSHNNHGFVVAYLALARLGAISVPVNFMLNADEVGYIFGHAGIVGVIAEDALAPVAAQALVIADLVERQRLRVFIPEKGTAPPAGWQPVGDLMAHDDGRAPEIVVGDDDAIQMLYTSGTESRPKGAVMTSRNLIAQYMSCIVDGEMAPDDVEIHALPLFHCAQLHCFLTVDLYVGATSIVLPAPDPATILGLIESERVTKFFAPPTVWIALLRHHDFDRRDLSSLRKGYYGASIMPVEVIKELGRRLPQVRLFNFYGQTEMSPMATLLRPEDQFRKLGSAGKASINVETLVVDDDDRPVPVGEVGEIVHRGPHVMKEYWQDPAKTAESFRNGWFHSGDLGRLDEEGYLYVVDRKKDMIKTGGENVASREVEETIYQHPAVSEVAVFGVPHPRWIEAVVAAVVPRAGQSVSADDLAVFCRERLAGYKTPKTFVVVEQLPKNASGKILKRNLRIMYEEISE
ncbi:fatty acyl-CoA synthetase [Zavarzinia aquatilis]|uniref:3-methylmercaptopropionyl-CoA ligase n=1 Tax=Zavarzinia aquatilis TaxID=2211142 RepID=A0A317E2U9_9PROT|nr:fatty acyl-CoA synthetase [Zavarzinia aquatilis]PWR21418.1 acyl-CoA synthetase [Zavarzinia aquatilis]